MIKIGVVGAGGNAIGNAKNLAASIDRCRIVAVADPVPAAAKKLADVYGAKACADLTEILPLVDAVVISSPNFLHPAQTIAAAKAGKHVWCEKPMALSEKEAQEMVDAVKKAHVASFVGFSVRFEPTMIKMKEVLKSGSLGTPIGLFSRRLCYLGPSASGSWRFDYSKSGGVMSELIAHEIDWLVDFAGDPISVFCRKFSQKHSDPRENDHIYMTMAFENEVTGTIEGSQISPLAEYYRGIVGTKASVYSSEWGGKVLLWKLGAREPVSLDLPGGFNKHAHFLDVIEGKCPSVADVEWGKKIVRISEQAIASAVSGENVQLK